MAKVDPFPHYWLTDLFRFLLVSLNIESILQESTIHRRRERLSKMIDGPGLEGVYGATIERIKAQDGDKAKLGLGALMWISHAERPLTADDLCHALAIELGSRDLNHDNIPSIATLVGCCQGLISVDKEQTTVRLIHFTLKEYFSARPDVFNRPHSTIAEICLTYLNSDPVKALPGKLSVNTRVCSCSGPRPDELGPFLGYCSLYWGVHAKKELSDCARLLSLELLHEYDYHISIRFLVEHIDDPDYFPGDCIRLSGLHCASFFGIVEVVVALVEMRGYTTSECFFLGTSPLAWAARNGHEEVVKIFLGREDVDPNEADDSYRTPLHYAAAGGNEEVVKMLLQRDEVNPDMEEMFGRTPLAYAARGGFLEVVEILLGRQEVNPNTPDSLRLTPLSYAAARRGEGIVKILLGREEVTPDIAGYNGRTPLSYAAEWGNVEAVKMLLGRKEVNPDSSDRDGRTPLSWAVAGEHEGVAKILLGREEVNPDKLDKNGLTPRMFAARVKSMAWMTLL